MMFGREDEGGVVLRTLRAAVLGQGEVLLIEGEPGAGKSALLADAAERAAGLGFGLASGRCEDLGQPIPLAPLLAVLDEPPIDRLEELIEHVRQALGRLAADRPLLIALDDLQCAHPATLTAVRILAPRLRDRPVVWMLTRRTAQAADAAERLFDLMEADGAARIRLGPLCHAAVAALAADILAATPDPELLALAAGAGGNPYMLVELFTGLRDEGLLRVDRGRAHLPAAVVPRRVRGLVRRDLDRLAPATRYVIETAAALGPTFAPQDAAEILGTTPAELLPALEEALAAGVLAATQEAFTFRRELFWRAVVAGLPAPMLRALHGQIGEVLLARGATAEAAGHLVLGVRPGDARVLAELDQAAAEVLPTAPSSAADLALRALELTVEDDPALPERRMTAIAGMTAAGRLDEAAQLIRSALFRPQPQRAASELHCALSRVLYIGGQMAAAAAEAELALAEPDLPGSVRDRAELALLNALAGSHDTVAAEARAQAVLAAPDAHGDAVYVGAMAVLAVIRWDSGRLSDGLGLARRAVRHATGASAEARRTHPRLALAAMLTDIRLFDEARAVLRDAREEVESLGDSSWAPGPALLGARMELAAGNLDEAVNEADSGLAGADSLGIRLFSTLGMSVLGMVAFRRGDLAAAARYVKQDGALRSHCSGGHADARSALVAAHVAEVTDGPVKAMRLCDAICADLGRHGGVLIGEPGAAAWLVRTALAAEDLERAETVAAACAELSAANPGFPTVAVAAAHVRGLLTGDRDALAEAVDQGSDEWTRASAAEDLGVLLAARGDRQGAVGGLDTALAGYEGTGAIRDTARVRRRLRRLGVRRRHWAPVERPVFGWASLTETQRTVALAVAQGLTNRQVAEQMFISVHTVAFHLRQVFRRLHINSRVELARIVAGQDLGRG
ncbi:AAA family ATPase [Streptosporangiaceae bacterium NEAU-GS5]|nr:AAA family ATPase [Streptosporangiaceae bacterium NEAU-GS5]